MVMIDDSLVRGTTAGPLVKLVRDAGATEVHVRITCPPITHACHFGVDMGHDGDLMAARLTVDEMREQIGADSLAFLSLDGMMRAVAARRRTTTTATATPASPGSYPIERRRRPGQARASRGCSPDAGPGHRIGGGREQAIAWACRHHGHDVTASPPTLGDASTDDTDLVIPGPEAALVAGVADECAAPRHPVLRTDRRAGPARVVEGVHPRAGDVARHPRRRAFAPLRRRRSEAIAWWRELGRAGRRQARRPRRGQGRHRARRSTAETDDRHPIAGGRVGPFVLEERLRGPECSLLALCDGARAVAAAHRPGPQAHRRGRHRTEHRRHGRLRTRSGPLRRRRAARDVRAAGPRPPRRARERRTSACSTPG